VVRVVFDSNVYISALLFGGTPRDLIALAENGQVQVFISEPLKGEVERVLATKFAWPADRIENALSHLWALTQTVIPSEGLNDCKDSDDNRVLECAIEADVAAIVTGDRHLLDLHPYRGIAILTPRQFFSGAA
jgi:putative PIN family toxin of toxin-antitoxin system